MRHFFILNNSDMTFQVGAWNNARFRDRWEGEDLVYAVSANLLCNSY